MILVKNWGNFRNELVPFMVHIIYISVIPRASRASVMMAGVIWV